MNCYKLYMKLYRLIFNRKKVFSQSDEQGLLQGWNSLLVRPEPLLIKDIKVQLNKQKPSPDSYRDTSSPDEAQQR